ncbi:class I SAM-dependent methyltransferase [Almyronema epifaneia]|uniref:Class I SAM-dependent methyltransferase n=1 Tax=Almyronema epifaneia S1 TaxID=2991925 RepID=A0ABW6IIA0_9CYAN
MGIGKAIQGQKTFPRDKFILEHCSKKSVLHVGCTDYPFFIENSKSEYFLHKKVVDVSEKTVGIDISQAEIDTMKTLGYEVYQVDAQKMSEFFQNNLFDVVLLADVIEHIPNPGLVFQESVKLLKKDGKIIVTVPNAFGIIRFLKTFFRYEQVHPDHISYYSSGTLETLAKRFDLKIVEMSWYQFEVRDKRWIVYLSAFLERIATVCFPWQAEGCLAVMKQDSQG